MDKVKLDVLRPWISKKITEYLHIEDDVVVEFVYNQLEDKVNTTKTVYCFAFIVSCSALKTIAHLFCMHLLSSIKYPCPKKMQINMTGFLNGKNARQFMDELWALLLSAQESETGIPEEFIQQKKDEILRREEENKLFDKEKSDSETARSGRFRPRSSRDSSREPSIHQQPSPSPGPRKQSADSTSVPDKNEDITTKSKRSPSTEKSKDNPAKISSSKRERSRDRSAEKSRSRHTNSRNHSERDSKKRDSEERKSDAKSALSNIQNKLINIAEGKKRNNRSRSRSRSRSHSNSRKSRSASRSRSR